MVYCAPSLTHLGQGTRAAGGCLFRESGGEGIAHARDVWDRCCHVTSTWEGRGQTHRCLPPHLSLSPSCSWLVPVVVFRTGASNSIPPPLHPHTPLLPLTIHTTPPNTPDRTSASNRSKDFVYTHHNPSARFCHYFAARSLPLDATEGPVHCLCTAASIPVLPHDTPTLELPVDLLRW